MPALVAVQHDPHLKAFYELLQRRHKAKLQALVAVARKLLHAIYGIFRSQTPYDGNKLFPALSRHHEEKGLPLYSSQEKKELAKRERILAAQKQRAEGGAPAMEFTRGYSFSERSSRGRWK